MMKKVELLAPCGNYECFLAAVNAGADAVYLGGKQFGARAYADNFSEEELIRVIYEAHLFGLKVYMTVNTLVKEKELSLLSEYMIPYYEAGLDGVIVQDMGVLQLLKRNFPALALHASTQMTITGAYGAKYLKEQGCSRIVPARELSLQEIRDIKDKVDIEIETFIHGAMCYCYSGQCLMSSMIGGRSGNRGKCAQPCRLPYSISGKEGYFLSLKDMNTLEHIPELLEAGIDSFKIEGRMKKPEYVAGVVSIYRKYIDKYNDKYDEYNKYNEKSYGLNERSGNNTISQKDRKILSNLYIRSETGNGYYDKAKGRDMLTRNKPGYNGTDEKLLAWLRENYIRKLPEIPIKITVSCKVGEPLYGEVKLNRQDNSFRKIGTFQSPKEICLSLSGPVVEKAEKRASSEEEIRAQLIKTGGTPFVVSACTIELSGNPFVPVKWLKELRRGLLQKIYELHGARTGSDIGREKSDHTCHTRYTGQAGAYFLTVTIQKKEQFFSLFHAIKEEKSENTDKDTTIKSVDSDKKAEGKISECLVVDADLLLEEKDIQKLLLESGICWGIKCPMIIRQQDEQRLLALRTFIEEGKPELIYCATADMLSWLRGIGCQGRIAGEASLYAWNREACRFWNKELDRITISPELSSREIRDLCRTVGAQEYSEKLEISVYGRTPLMVTANCVKLSSRQCDRDRTRYAKLTDRFKNVFPVYTRCGHNVASPDIVHGCKECNAAGGQVSADGHCYNIIYNCLPTSYYGSLWMFLQDSIRNFRLDFTTENGPEAVQIWKTFKNLIASEIMEGYSGKKGRKKEKLPGMETTVGRLHPGVE